MAAGRVTVNGAVVSEMGIKVVPGRDQVEVDGVHVSSATTRWVAFHKPPGVLTTRTDPHGGETIYDILPDDMGGLRYVGRLDRDAEGLLLLTNDGDVAQALQRPVTGVEREYRVEVAGKVTRDTTRLLWAGVELEDGIARPTHVEIVESGDVSSVVDLVLTEGRKREVRRLMSAVGHPVMKLKRMRFGPVRLGDLERGAWREIGASECAALVARAGRRS